MISHKHWLAHEMPQWIREEIITEDGAEKLRRKYTVKTVRREDILMRIALIMAVCFMAAGICFIIADNWHSFSQGSQFFFAWLLLFISVLTDITLLGPVLASEVSPFLNVPVYFLPDWIS